MAESRATKELKFPSKYENCIDRDSYTRFLTEDCRASGIRYALFSFPTTITDLLGNLSSRTNTNQFLFYWEKPSDSLALAASGALLHISASGPNRFEDIHTQIQSAKRKTVHFNASGLLEAGIHFLGGFSFFDQINDENWKNFNASSFKLPKRTILKKNGSTSFTLALAVDQTSTAGEIHDKVLHELALLNHKNNAPISEYSPTSNGTLINGKKIAPAKIPFEYEKWVQNVNLAKQWISEKGLKKVVLSRQMKLNKKEDLTPIHILQDLRSHYPKCSSFLIKMKGSATFVGCSPEKLLSFNENMLHTEALAGSIARGTDQKEDSLFELELLDSKKNNIEHNYVVHSIESDLDPYVHQLKRRDQPVIKKLANVQHLYTPLKAQIRKNTNPLSILGQLHPTPAVGGYPRKTAETFIQNNESFNRGWFASPIGWINGEGSGEFTVAIRSGLIDKTSALLFAGCGIVADSDPAKEWEETNLKLLPMLSALSYD